MLRKRLFEVQNILMQLSYYSEGTNTAATYLDLIRKFYEFEKGRIEVDVSTVISEKDKKYLLQNFEKYFDEDFKQRSKIKHKTQELEEIKNKISVIIKILLLDKNEKKRNNVEDKT